MPTDIRTIAAAILALAATSNASLSDKKGTFKAPLTHKKIDRQISAETVSMLANANHNRTDESVMRRSPATVDGLGHKPMTLLSAQSGQDTEQAWRTVRSYFGMEIFLNLDVGTPG